MRLIKVKPLVWNDREYSSTANVGSGAYSTYLHMDKTWRACFSAKLPGLIVAKTTREEAKQSCQDHWEKHVRGKQ